MKTFMKSLVAIALVATMLVASMIVVSAKDENLATSATYTIVRLTEGPGSAEEETAQFVGANNGDDVDFNRLNDGWNKPAESVKKSVFLAGSGRTHRIKFDLGAEKTVSKVVLYMKDNYRRVYNGNHASNRGYNKDDGFAVYSDAAATKSVKFKLTEAAQKDADGNDVEDFYAVTLTFNKAVTTRYITLDVQAEQSGKHPECADDEANAGAYVVSINEIEIFGGAASSTPTEKAGDDTQSGATDATESQVARPTQKTTDTGDSTSIAFIAVIAVISLAGAAVVLKKKSF